MNRTTNNERIVDFDATLAVDEYRHIIATRDAMTDASARLEYDRLAQFARARWADWQGEDSLHQLAFGEPLESEKTR